MQHPHTGGRFRAVSIAALAVGLVGGLACLVAAITSTDAFLQAYLFAYLFWLGVSLGCLLLLMVYHVIGGEWGFLTRRIMEAAALAMPLLTVLFLPILLGMGRLFAWTHPEQFSDPALQHKLPYLNGPAFIARAIIYFLVWNVLAALLNRWSSAQDRPDNIGPTVRLRMLSRAGLVLYWFAVVFAAKDWAMSLNPLFNSSIYSLMFIAGQALAGIGFVIVVLSLLARRPELADVAGPTVYNVLGNILLAALMFWAYTQFCQFLIIWMGNEPQEAGWYLARETPGWLTITLLVVFVQFGLPFLALMPRTLKANIRALASIAAIVLCLRLVSMFWMVVPELRPAFALSWVDLAAPAGIGGLWVAGFAWLLGRKPLLVAHDPHVGAAEPTQARFSAG